MVVVINLMVVVGSGLGTDYHICGFLHPFHTERLIRIETQINVGYCVHMASIMRIRIRVVDLFPRRF